MAKKNEANWQAKFNELKAYIAVNGHLPDKHNVENRNLLSWAKYQRRKIKEGTLEDEKKALFLELLAKRSTEHTGGRKKLIPTDTL